MKQLKQSRAYEMTVSSTSEKIRYEADSNPIDLHINTALTNAEKHGVYCEKPKQITRPRSGIPLNPAIQ
jgi:hypothetical protein